MNNANINGSYSSGTGSIVGEWQCSIGIIENCYNTGNIKLNSTSYYAGGIIWNVANVGKPSII